nr:elongation factor P hydroxylase [Halomonas colorata]
MVMRLLEMSHWCIAGAKRRQLEDYGYWYLPDGRNAQEQSAFEQAEIAPQALESLFADACGRTFHVSVDNLGGNVEVDRAAFAEKVNARKQRYLQEGLPTRANALYVTLTSFYQREEPLAAAIAQGRSVLDHAPVAVNA